MEMTFPEIVIPVLEFPGGTVGGGTVGSASSVDEHEVKKATPKVANTTEAPVFSRNFLRDSVKLPVLVTSTFSIYN